MVSLYFSLWNVPKSIAEIDRTNQITPASRGAPKTRWIESSTPGARAVSSSARSCDGLVVLVSARAAMRRALGTASMRIFLPLAVELGRENSDARRIAAGFGEMRRVLTPGGHLLFVEHERVTSTLVAGLAAASH
jgi:hypothetical protein